MKIICNKHLCPRKQKSPCWWSVTFGSLLGSSSQGSVPTLCVRLVCYWYFTFASLYTSLVRIREGWCQGIVDASYWYHGCPAHVLFMDQCMCLWDPECQLLNTAQLSCSQELPSAERKQPCPGLVVASFCEHEKLFSCVWVGPTLLVWVVLQNSGKH